MQDFAALLNKLGVRNPMLGMFRAVRRLSDVAPVKPGRALLFLHSPGLGGAERAAIETAEQLRSAGYSVKVYIPASGAVEKELKSRNLPYRRSNLGWWCFLTREAAPKRVRLSTAGDIVKSGILAAKLLAERPEIVIANSVVAPWPLLVGKLLGTKTIWYVHEFGDTDHELYFPYGFKRQVAVAGVLADKVVTCSQAVREHLENAGVQVDDVLYYPMNLKGRDRLTPFRADEIRLVCVGHIKPTKGQQTLLDAAKKVSQRLNREVFVRLIGPYDEDYKRQLYESVAGSPLLRISVEGFRPNPFKDVLDTEIFVVPSVNEAFGRVTVEAAANGNLVVGTRSGGTREIIEDRSTGFLFEPKSSDSLAGVIEEVFRLGPEEIDTMRKRAVTRAMALSDPEEFKKRLRSAIEAADSRPDRAIDWQLSVAALLGPIGS